MKSTRNLAQFEKPDGQLSPPRRLDANMAAKVRRQHALVLGVGAIARQTTRILRRLGIRQFTLVDPKRYVPASVGQQCRSGEVGRLKVEVVGQELRQSGAQVHTFATDLFNLPDGVIDADTFVLLSVDNRRAEVRANHLATRMDADVVKANVEPLYGVASVRSFHSRGSEDACLECNFTDRQYEQQRHPQSCDGGSTSRRTASPTALTGAAAGLAAAACIGLLNPSGRGQWLGYEVQFSTQTRESRRSRLQSNPRCRWQHDGQWPMLRQLHRVPAQISLRQLVEVAERDSGDKVQRFRFCHPVAVVGRCGQCGIAHSMVRWVPDASVSVDSCRKCGQPVLPVPFEMHRELTRHQLLPVWELVMSSWGVLPLAVIELIGRRPIRTYVLGHRKSLTPQP